ncbi:nucleoside phosphatase GDA1/CD39 [Neoconidiobolus thromboides FSU 785]|nr:nucleoside phosphatase GDA1/CD39 [Neoconidiobolus thromboides FSU 785]
MARTNNYKWVKRGKDEKERYLNYGIIMDAGSTGTRLFVYEWNNPRNCYASPYVRPSLHTSGPKQGKQYSIKKSGGLADLNPNQVQSYLKDFIGNVTRFVPKSEHSKTPIFLKATAGMRLLSKKQSNDIMEQVKEVLKTSSFKFDLKFGAQVIPGEYEGIFGWLAGNYMAGVLNNNNNTATGLSYGMLDMGGASCQITFEASQVPIENSFPISLNGTSRILYTHSYLRFGRNEAKSRYEVNEINPLSKGYGEKIKDPCFVKGYKGKTKDNIEFEGSGDFKRCISNTKRLLLKDSFCSTMSCAINGVYQPDIPDDMKLIAVSAMYGVANWFKCKGKSNIQCLLKNADSVCSNLNHEEYLKVYSKTSDDKNINDYCFMAAYIVNIVKEGYGLSLDRTIYFDEEIDSVEIGWTLGAMIYEVNSLSLPGKNCAFH